MWTFAAAARFPRCKRPVAPLPLPSWSLRGQAPPDPAPVALQSKEKKRGGGEKGRFQADTCCPGPHGSHQLATMHGMHTWAPPWTDGWIFPLEKPY